MEFGELVSLLDGDLGGSEYCCCDCVNDRRCTLFVLESVRFQHLSNRE